MAIMDFNDRRNDSAMGTVTFDLKTLAEDGEQTGLQSDVIHNGQPRGRINFDVNYYPVLKAKKASDGTLEPLPETSEARVAGAELKLSALTDCFLQLPESCVSSSIRPRSSTHAACRSTRSSACCSTAKLCTGLRP